MKEAFPRPSILFIFCVLGFCFFFFFKSSYRWAVGGLDRIQVSLINAVVLFPGGK